MSDIKKVVMTKEGDLSADGDAHMQHSRELFAQIAARSANDAAADESPPAATAPMNIHIDPTEWQGRLKAVCGSQSDHFNNELADQVARTLWPPANPAMREQQLTASMAALVGIAPRDELEGMLAAQMVAAHAATMECFRRSMLPEQSPEARAMNLGMANKSSRTFGALIEALNRYRGKSSQQRVIVEHVTVHAGGQAIVGAVDSQGGGRGDGTRSAKRRHAKQIAHAPEPAMPCTHPNGGTVSITGDGEPALSDARRDIDRRAEGEQQRSQGRPLHRKGEGRATAVGRNAARDAAADQDG
jgi:hypothetical protein